MEIKTITAKINIDHARTPLYIATVCSLSYCRKPDVSLIYVKSQIRQKNYSASKASETARSLICSKKPSVAWEEELVYHFIALK
jgi:hypothetical protein